MAFDPPPLVLENNVALFFREIQKFCNDLFWIGNDAPPLEVFQKFIRIWGRKCPLGKSEQLSTHNWMHFPSFRHVDCILAPPKQGGHMQSLVKCLGHLLKHPCPKQGRYWEIQPQPPRDFLRPKRFFPRDIWIWIFLQGVDREILDCVKINPSLPMMREWDMGRGLRSCQIWSLP